MYAQQHFTPRTQSTLSPVPTIDEPSLVPVYAIRTHDDLHYVTSVTKPRSSLPLGQFFLAHGALTETDLKEVLAMQRSMDGRRIGWILKTMGYVDELTLGRVLAARHGVPCVSLAQYRASGNCRQRVPDVATRDHGIAILHEDAQKAWLAMADVTDAQCAQVVAATLGKAVASVMAPHRELMDFS